MSIILYTVPMITTTTSTALTRGYTSALASAAILSTTAVFIRHLTCTYALPPLVLALWRDLFTVLTLLMVLAIFHPARLRLERRHLPMLAGYGLLLALFNALWTLSVALNGAAAATVMVYSSAAFTALLGRLFLREEMNPAKAVAIVLSMTGCILVCGALDAAVWRTQALGVLTGVLSGLGYAAYSLMGRVAAGRGITPWTTLLYTFGAATLFLLVFNLLPDTPLPGAASRVADLGLPHVDGAGWAVLFLLAAGPTVAGFGLYNISLSYLPCSVANLIVTLEPAFTTVLAYFLLHERLQAAQIAGAVLIMSAVAVLRLHDARTARRAAAT